MWDNPRLLNLLAGMLIGLALLSFAIGGAQRLLRSRLFPLHEILLTQPLERTTRAEIESAVRARVSENFLALDLGFHFCELEDRACLPQEVAVLRVGVDGVGSGEVDR